MDYEDVELVARTLAGDRGAFDKLIERHYHLVFRLAARISGNAADAEDLTQQTFVRAYSSLRQFDLGRSFRQWLCAIVVNRAKSFRRQEAGRRSAGVDMAGDNPTPDSVFDGVARRLLTSEVHAAIAKLPIKQRLALILMALEGMTSAEAAEVMHCSEPTARVHLWRAKKRLAAELADWMHEEEKNHELSRGEKAVAPSGNQAAR